jgi:hypothetical protein
MWFTDDPWWKLPFSRITVPSKPIDGKVHVTVEELNKPINILEEIYGKDMVIR